MPEFAPREFLAGKDARTLATELVALTQEEYSAATKVRGAGLPAPVVVRRLALDPRPFAVSYLEFRDYRASLRIAREPDRERGSLFAR